MRAVVIRCPPAPCAAARTVARAQQPASADSGFASRARARVGRGLTAASVGVAAAAVVLVAGAASAQVVDTTLWITDGGVNAVVRDGNTIYIGGYFGAVGPATGGGVPLGAAGGAPVRPFSKVLGTVLATVADGSGGWYVGGNFSAVGGLERSNLAHILADGSVADWSPNPNGAIHALAFDGERVYAGGEFTWIGWRWRDGIAAVDGTTGTATAWNPDADALVRTLAVSGSTLYAGGDFTTIGGRVRSRIAALDVATGAATEWNPDAGGTVYALTVSDATVYAGGSFSTMGGQSRPFLAALDAVSGAASDWRPAPNSSVWCLAVSGGTVYAGGFFSTIGGQPRRYIAALDAASGSATTWDPNANSLVRTLAVGAGVVYVGGSFTTIGGQSRRQAAALDAAAGMATPWDPGPGGAEPTVYALAVSGSSVYMGGSFTMVGGVTRRHIAALDATTGMATDWNPVANATVHALAVGSGTVYAGGSFSSIGGQARIRIAALDAATGAATPWDPSPAGSPNWPEVKALAVEGTTVYAAGTFNSIAGQVRNHVAALDAATGAALPWNPDANGSIHALVVSGSTVYVGGLFTRVGGQPRNNIAALDVASGAATPWNPNASTLVSSLAAGQGLVYAAGVFSSIGGKSRRYIAALDAASGAATGWDPSADRWMYALAVGQGVVYAGGDMTTIGGQARAGVAALDAVTGRATAWNPGVVGGAGVRTLAVDGSTILAGGHFSSIGGQPRPCLAAITAAVPDPVPDPTFVGPVVLSAQTIALGESVTITATVRNDGADSDDGRIVFSFKDLGDPLDVQRVSVEAGDDTPGTRVLPAGSGLTDRDCQPVTASYLVAEYVDGDWRGPGDEVNTLRVTARPRAAGVFSIDVRSTMRAAGGPPCAYVSDLPADGHTYLTDQQGWTVRRFVVYVTGPPTTANPTFTDMVGLSAAAISLGSSVTITAGVRNDGAASDDGRVVFSFPTLTDPLDAQRVSSASSGDAPGYRTFGPGSVMVGRDGQPVTTSYLVAEYADSSWLWIGEETNTFSVTVRPPETGTFIIDVRSTMHTAGGAPSDQVSDVPGNGQTGFTDQQGWSVNRFVVTVDPPPTEADPVFTAAVSLSAGTIALGDSVTITAQVRNDGVASDDGRIVFSFPSLSDPLDAQRIGSASGGDDPGYRVFPAGSTVLGRNCQPVTATCLVAEYADADWRGPDDETNTFSVTVRPRQAGLFHIDVRSTMRTAGAGPCEYVSGLPPNGQIPFTDAQGWPVRRLTVTVGRPDPIFPAGVGVSAGQIILGQSITITASARNDGARSDDGRIVFAFPTLTDSLDAQRVSLGPAGDAPGYRAFPAGSSLLDRDCGPVTAPHLLVEYGDGDWQGLANEINTATVTVRPRQAGTFVFDVRSTMHSVGGPCDYVSEVPPDGGEGYTDPQGWPVGRFVVHVHGASTWADPTFIGDPGFSAHTIALGDSVTITASVRNDGAGSDDGRIVLAFPDLNDPGDASRVQSVASGDEPGFRMFPAGSAVPGRDCQPVSAPYLVAEYADSVWESVGDETNTFRLTVRPRQPGVFAVDVRSIMHTAAGMPCDYVGDVPAGGVAVTDPQGWPVRRFSVTVTGPPVAVAPKWAELALAGASPNPARGELAVAFALPGSGAGSLELYDLGGRRVARQDLSDLGAGAHRVVLARERALGSGVYLVRLTHGGRVLTAKACVMR